MSTGGKNKNLPLVVNPGLSNPVSVQPGFRLKACASFLTDIEYIQKRVKVEHPGKTSVSVRISFHHRLDALSPDLLRPVGRIGTPSICNLHISLLTLPPFFLYSVSRSIERSRRMFSGRIVSGEIRKAAAEAFTVGKPQGNRPVLVA